MCKRVQNKLATLGDSKQKIQQVHRFKPGHVREILGIPSDLYVEKCEKQGLKRLAGILLTREEPSHRVQWRK